jgi:nucleotide-binding universal stress UspA family protein
LPIVRDKTLLGIITSSDLARRMYEENRSDPTLMAMFRFQEVEKLTEAKDNQNVQEKTKLEHSSSNMEQDMLLQSIPKFERILVPYDASEMSDKALKYAIYLSKISNSHIFILNVIENYEDLKEVLPTTIRAEQEKKLERSNKNDSQGVDLKVSVEGALRKVIEEKIRLCQEAGLDTQITYEIHTGKASDEIINLAAQEDFDLIVMASHRITSTLKSMGSTARKVMDNVKKPILLIHE